MKKILILANGTIALYRFRRELFEAFAGAGWQVLVSSPDDGFLDKLRAIGITFINTPIDRHGTNPVRDFTLLWRYRKMMRETKPDIILTYTIKPNIYGNLAAKGLSIPVVSSVTGLGDAFLRDDKVSRIVKALYRWAFRKTACVACQNREDMDILRENGILTDQRVLLTPGSGVNLSEYSPLDYPKTPIVSFLYVGRIMRSKGVGLLLDAAQRLHAERPGSFTVTLIGYHDGDLIREVEQAQREGIARYAGFQGHIEPFVRKAHCVVLPSYKEGMSNALLEAAAMGRPLIASDVSGCREIVDYGINGFLCTPRDASSLYECMKRFLALKPERRADMGVASRSKVESEFDRALVVKVMMELIGELSGK